MNVDGKKTCETYRSAEIPTPHAYQFSAYLTLLSFSQDAVPHPKFSIAENTYMSASKSPFARISDVQCECNINCLFTIT